jgi:ribosome biogenesis GTPase
MTLEDLGYNETFGAAKKEQQLEDFEMGRVIAEHKERYVVKTEQGELEAEITGNLRYTATGREDFPAVGDWVSLMVYDSHSAIIHSVLPRTSVLSRQAFGKFGETQIIATNIDVALLVQAVDRDFNVNRLERYLTICYASKVRPVIVLTKTDLIETQQLEEIIPKIEQRIQNVPILSVNSEAHDGYKALTELIQKGKTYCLLGSSGVGKSTLTNNLSGKNLMKTNSISKSTNKGRHVTSHRELIVLDNGGILIDNPGMREIGVVDTAEGMETAFDQIYRLAEHCKFKDCTHTNEVGCAVLEALENGELDRKSYDNFRKLEREKTHFDHTVAEKRKKDKEFGKMVKQFKNLKKSRKF